MVLVVNSLTHVHAALDAYLTANLLFADGSPVDLQLHGVRRFIRDSDLPWVEAHYDFLGLQQTYWNRAGQQAALAIIGTQREGYLQLNLYQRARVFATRYTTAIIRDIVVGAFPDGELIPVYDDAPLVVQEGNLVLDGIQEHVVDTGLHSGVVQHVLQVFIRYLELYTRSV